MDELIIFNDIFEIDKEKLSFIIEDDRRFTWHYITLFYNDKPCSLDRFKLHYGINEYDDYEYPIIKNSNGIDSFLVKSDARLYFKNNLLYNNDFKCKFIKEEVYQTVDIDKSKLDIAFFDDEKFEEIKSENDGIRDYYKLKDNVGHYFILYKNSVIKHIGTCNYFDFYDVEDNISEKIFIKNV
ncbi:6163_t:CDS:2 [Dentiscutata erythropus]|uniref:6163_t:CDS:1 n=1 Tax=Dentiscutata erythropus TaxID=1348616 RepID=A0A9N9NSH6_9GLOM|nr:6163_t:CDS:2 [Dentiscutata erythropus]